MFFVPTGGDPTRYAEGATVVNAFGRQGGTIAMEVFLQNSPIAVRAVACGLPCVASGGLDGSIEYEEDSGFVDEDRMDFIIFGEDALVGIDDSCHLEDFPHFKAAIVFEVVDSILVCDPKYFFSFEMAISPDAEGTFTLDFIGLEEHFTGVFDLKGLSIPGFVLESLVIDLSPPDCDENGIDDVCDLDCGAKDGECGVVGCGSRLDCNVNGIPDRCDVAEGTSGDCTGNGVPDECEADCDSDGVADGCALLECSGDPDCADCNENAIPDRCDITACGGAVGCGDCNANRVPDACDIARGTSRDDNGNDGPDEWDPPPGDEPRLFFVPRGGNPDDFASRLATVLSVRPGESRTLQVWVQNSGRPLGSYQITIGDAVGGDSGAVPFDSPLIDQFNPNWVYTGLPGVFQVTDIGPPARMTSVASSAAPVVNEPRYCGELTYEAALNACGEFAVDFVNPGALQGESQTLLLDAADNAFEFTAVGAQIRVSEKVFGDVNNDGVTDLFDILCLLNGFGGDFSGDCILSDVDLVPCDGDGAILLEDILAVLNGFSGQLSPCPIVCPPAGRP